MVFLQVYKNIFKFDLIFSKCSIFLSAFGFKLFLNAFQLHNLVFHSPEPDSDLTAWIFKIKSARVTKKGLRKMNKSSVFSSLSLKSADCDLHPVDQRLTKQNKNNRNVFNDLLTSSCFKALMMSWWNHKHQSILLTWFVLQWSTFQHLINTENSHDFRVFLQTKDLQDGRHAPTWPMKTTFTCSFLGASGGGGATFGTGISSSSSSIIIISSSSLPAAPPSPQGPSVPRSSWPPPPSPPPGSSFCSHVSSSVVMSASEFPFSTGAEATQTHRSGQSGLDLHFFLFSFSFSKKKKKVIKRGLWRII